jgi:hypothetical protein
MAKDNGAARTAANEGARPSLADHGIHLRTYRPRVVDEILLRLVPDRGALIRKMQRYVRHDPAFIRAIGAHDWLDLRDLLREVRP